ncbi:MAG: molybdopterin-synthase adenylyltransferase MoeB [Bacteroidales bacterium]|nr:molybdopterin-synthase adenylyltransferase MoeB [Bacteroidales bacterium]
MLSKEELLRYNRHIIMPEVGTEGQTKLKKAKVLVIGTGGLGCPVLLYLTAAGVGNIGIIDFDTVSESNLQRQILFDTHDIGKSKAKVAAKKLKAQNPYVNFEVYSTKFSKQNALKLVGEYDLVIDGTDNFPSRYLLNDACVISGKPFVFGAIYKFYGQVSVFNYKNGPTYRCLFPEQPQEDEVPNCSTIGVIGAIPGIIGTLQASEAIKIILGKGEIMSGKLFQIDLLSLNIDLIDIYKDEEAATIRDLSEYNTVCSDDEQLQIHTISPLDLYEKIQNKEQLSIYDVREKHQFDDYRIGGQFKDAGELLEHSKNIPSDHPLIIVCEFGEKSLALVEYLQHSEGFNNIYNLEGGIQGWIKAGLPFIDTIPKSV